MISHLTGVSYSAAFRGRDPLSDFQATQCENLLMLMDSLVPPALISTTRTPGAHCPHQHHQDPWSFTLDLHH
ncbi:unnamed protein product [Boreogadus saida]